MVDSHLELLSDIRQQTRDRPFVTLYELEVLTGLPGEGLRPVLEDLKERGYVVEHPEGFQLTPPGVSFCRGRWA
jgi:hypothetical protein